MLLFMSIVFTGVLCSNVVVALEDDWDDDGWVLHLAVAKGGVLNISG